MTSVPKFQCPICHKPLAKADKSLKCENNHQFDYAKEGYVHLLPVQMKKSLHPGDDKQMVLARRAFLELGHYEFLRTALLTLVKERSNDSLVDLGCGEGYYTNYIQSQTTCPQMYGIDISKDAVKYAAKRNKDVHYSVATNAHTPLADNFAEQIINVFAPLVGKECQRILKANGVIISANPGAKHLLELKQFVYEHPELHQPPKAPEGFVVQHEQTIEQQVQLTSPSDIENLLLMTPFGWKISADKKQTLLATTPFTVTLSFVISEYIVDPST